MTHMELAHRLVLLAIPLLVGGCLSGSADEATESGAQPDILLGEEDAVDAPDTEDPVVPATVVMVPAPIAEDSPPARGDDDEPDSPPPVTASPEEREPAPPADAPLDVDAFIRALPSESIVFNAPTSMQFDETVRVRLLIQPGTAGADLVARFSAVRQEDERGELVQDVAPVGEEMGARLESSGLDVTALTPESQLLSLTEPTQWRWDVQASEGGIHQLELSLYAIAPGRSSGRTILTYQREMIVEVSFKAWAADIVSTHWEWLWTLLLAPVGAWLWRRSRRRG